MPFFVGDKMIPDPQTVQLFLDSAKFQRLTPDTDMYIQLDAGKPVVGDNGATYQLGEDSYTRTFNGRTIVRQSHQGIFSRDTLLLWAIEDSYKPIAPIITGKDITTEWVRVFCREHILDRYRMWKSKSESVKDLGVKVPEPFITVADVKNDALQRNMPKIVNEYFTNLSAKKQLAMVRNSLVWWVRRGKLSKDDGGVNTVYQPPFVDNDGKYKFDLTGE